MAADTLVANVKTMGRKTLKSFMMADVKTFMRLGWAGGAVDIDLVEGCTAFKCPGFRVAVIYQWRGFYRLRAESTWTRYLSMSASTVVELTGSLL